MLEPFIPANLQKGDHYRVRSTFYASNVPIPQGQIVRVDWVNEKAEDRVYVLDICLSFIDPPGKTVIWGRSHPLDQNYVDTILEKLTKA